MAEARCAVSKDIQNAIHVKDYEQEVGSLWHETYILWMRTAKRRYYRIRNSIRNGMWPTSLWNLGISVVVLTGVQLYPQPWTASLNNALTQLAQKLPFPQSSPTLLNEMITSLVMGVLFFLVLMYVRRYLLRVLLSYRGWMYEPPRKQSLLTLVWGGMVRIFSGSHPTLYSCQRALPRMPVPPLRQTLDKLMESLKPVYAARPEEFSKLQEEATQFEKSLGPKLQRALIIKSWLSPNYVADWWEKYVYLMGRSPLPINSNYYVIDQSNWSPTTSQPARAASMTYNMLYIKQQIERETFDPLVIRGTIPICMHQYRRVFSTTRIPGEECDHLVTMDALETKHVIVYCKGVMYMLDVYDSRRRILPPQTLVKQFEWIIRDAEKQHRSYSDGEKSVAALTTLDRTTWWRLRKDHFSSGVNKESLQLVESAIVFVTLDDVSFEFKDLSGRGSRLLSGDGRCFWFDKSINMVVFKDGKMGINCEHSYADAPVVAHCIEYNIMKESSKECFDEEGVLFDKDTGASTQLTQPQRLVWQVDAELDKHISHAVTLHQQNIDDLDLCVADHENFGKGLIKTCKVSPDAFIQMAIQVAYLKNSGGKQALTYEAAMTRLFMHGRTETVRSLTTKAAAFAKGFVDKSVSHDEKRRLLVEACELHQVMYKDAMNGKAVDRHLFALYVVSRGLGYDCEFLKKVLSIPWTLSTSQQPQQQIQSAPDCGLPQYYDMLSPGGGFGPVSDEGYGVSYMVPGERRIFFHVSSKRSQPATDSKKFMQHLFETLQELKEAFATEL